MTPLTISLIALGIWAATPFVALLVIAIGTYLEKRNG